MSSLNLRNPENPNKQAVISLGSEREPELFASLTITSSISTVIGSFFTIGLAIVYCRPSNVALANGCEEGVIKPALECIQTTALAASSTAALDLVFSERCCRYNANSCGLAGKGDSL